jgi:ribonuclease T1
MPRLVAFIRLALFLALCGGFGFSASVQAREPAHAGSILAVALADLPEQARHTVSLIERGGPFPFPRKDGSTFGNFEKRLPIQERGYYREYTVPTPGSRDRGARRVVAGGGRSPGSADSARFGEYYYSDDHYRSFRRISQR